MSTVTTGMVDTLFNELIGVSERMQLLKIEMLEHELDVTKKWTVLVTDGGVEPGRNEEAREIQRRNLFPTTYAQMDVLAEDIKGMELELSKLKLQRERLDFLLRVEGK